MFLLSFLFILSLSHIHTHTHDTKETKLLSHVVSPSSTSLLLSSELCDLEEREEIEREKENHPTSSTSSSSLSSTTSAEKLKKLNALYRSNLIDTIEYNARARNLVKIHIISNNLIE